MAEIVETQAPIAATDSQAAPVLSFPAILRNPGITSRFAHLTSETREGQRSKPSRSASASLKKHRRENDGKRWIRRKDNGLSPR